jgi:hypothetical protein
MAVVDQDSVRSELVEEPNDLPFSSPWEIFPADLFVFENGMNGKPSLLPENPDLV